jgi:periplasmic protein TonB
MNVVVELDRRDRRRRLGEKDMKDVVVARGAGFVAGLGLVGAIMAGLAMMRFAPIAEHGGLKPPPLPPPEPDAKTQKPTQNIRQTAPIPFAPPEPVDFTPSPQLAPFVPAPPEPAPGPTISVIEIARPIGAPPRPSYPTRAEERGREGTVVVRLIVGADGDVTSAAIISEDPTGFGFGQAALAAVRRTKFEPKRVDGAATLGEFTYTVRFRLS